MASPELVPGAVAPFSSAEGYMLKRLTMDGPVVDCSLMNVSKRDHGSRLVANFQAGQISDLTAKVGIGLNNNLPVAPEAREIVDISRAEIDTQRVVDIAQIHPARTDEFAIGYGDDLRLLSTVAAKHARPGPAATKHHVPDS